MKKKPAESTRSLFVLLFFGVVLLALAFVVRSGILASKDPGEPINASMRAALAQERPEYTTEDSLLIDRLYPTANTRPSGLKYVVRNPGVGDAKPKIGDTVVAQYAGRLLDGTPFDSSYKTGVPFQFQLGVGQVIKGWDEAFLLMKKGERRTLIIPNWLAYGDAGRPPSIPPKATLIFEVELVDFHP